MNETLQDWATKNSLPSNFNEAVKGKEAILCAKYKRKDI